MNHELADPADRLGYLLWQSAHLVGRAMAASLEPFGLTPAQFGALVHVGREPGVSAAELARRLNLTPQSVQTALLPLLERGWLERRPHPVHKRVLGTFLTAAGLDQARAANKAVEESDSRLAEGLSTAQRSALEDGLRHVMTTLNPVALDRSTLRSPSQ